MTSQIKNNKIVKTNGKNTKASRKGLKNHISKRACVFARSLYAVTLEKTVISSQGTYSYNPFNMLFEGAAGKIYECKSETGNIKGNLVLKIGECQEDIDAFNGISTKLNTKFLNKYCCPILDQGKINGKEFVIMPKLNGITLEAFSRNVKNQQYLSKVMFQVLEIIMELQSNRIAHLDLHTKNFLVESNGKVWLIDFGNTSINAEDYELAQDIDEIQRTISYLLFNVDTMNITNRLGRKMNRNIKDNNVWENITLADVSNLCVKERIFSFQNGECTELLNFLCSNPKSTEINMNIKNLYNSLQ